MLRFGPGVCHIPSPWPPASATTEEAYGVAPLLPISPVSALKRKIPDNFPGEFPREMTSIQ